MRIPENHCMLLPKAQKMRAIKQTMALITDSIGCTTCAPAQMPWHLRHLNPALLNRQGMCTYPKMENGSELCHRKRQLIVGLRANPVRPRKPPQIGAKLGTLRGSTTRRNVKAPPYRHVSGQHGHLQLLMVSGIDMVVSPAVSGFCGEERPMMIMISPSCWKSRRMLMMLI